MTDPASPAWRATEPLTIGDFVALPASNELRGSGGVVRLRPLLMDVLLRLAATPGEVVPRERLIADAWPRRMVNDEVLSRTIAELRTALGDDARQARYVETIPKVGYRLVAPVVPGAHSPAAASASAPGNASDETAGKPPATAGKRRAPLAIAAGFAVAALLLALVYLARGDPPDAAAELERRLAAAQPFTADKALEIAPRFSPDGERIAYVIAEGSASRIAIQPVEGGPRRFVGEAGVVHHSPVFFPDGKRLAAWRSKGGECALVEHDLDAGTERTLLDCRLRPHARFDLSPDGGQLAVSATLRDRFPAGLVLVDVATGQLKPLTSPEPGQGDDVNPRFSPDGKRIAFFRGTASHRRVWTAVLDDPASAQPASPLEGLTYGAAWLGPAGPLVVAADWFGFRALNVLDPATGRARLLGARGARFPDRSHRGDVVFENASYEANLWRIDPGDETAPPRRLWPSTRYTNQAAFSPDGRQVVFVSNRDGLEGLYVAPLEGEAARLALPAGYRYIRPAFGADGRSLLAVRIALGASPSPVQHAVRIALPSGAVTVLEGMGAAVNAVRESHDGLWLFAGELSGHAMRLLRAGTATASNPERLPLPLVTEFQLNASSIVFTQPDLPGATSCRLAEWTCEPLDVALADGNRHDWLLTSRSIYLPLAGAAGVQLARYDLKERRLASRHAFGPTASGLAIAASPDERVLLVAREEGPAIDLMIARGR
jgi:DNA-binding winged helix-turn-helix (wHTH) protein/Tol biopolymer transport system component